jgi:hypothetical protein
VGETALLGWPTWVGVVVDDLEKQRRFWGDLLAVPEHHAGPDFVDFEMGDGRSFELIQRSDDPQYDRARFRSASKWRMSSGRERSSSAEE